VELRQDLEADGGAGQEWEGHGRSTRGPLLEDETVAGVTQKKVGNVLSGKQSTAE